MNLIFKYLFIFKGIIFFAKQTNVTNLRIVLLLKKLLNNCVAIDLILEAMDAEIKKCASLNKLICT